MNESWDVIVVGGGPGGLSAALYLGRALRRVLVIDEGRPRHAVSAGVHNFLTRDGIEPMTLRQIAWEQMGAYPEVKRRQARVSAMIRSGELWELSAGDGSVYRAPAVILATGVIDEHPDIPGYRERWGHVIQHCPFCHGWELRGRPLAVLFDPALGAHLPALLTAWSGDIVALTHGRQCPDEQTAELEGRGVRVIETPIAELRGPGRELAEIALADGTTLERHGLFVAAPQRLPEFVTGLVAGLDLGLTEQGYVAVDPMQRTNLPMLWAVGDLTSRMQQVVWAAAQGAAAAGSIQMTLVMG